MESKLSVCHKFGISGSFGSGKTYFYNYAKTKLPMIKCIELSNAYKLKCFVMDLYQLYSKKIDLNSTQGKETELTGKEIIDFTHFRKIMLQYFGKYFYDLLYVDDNVNDDFLVFLLLKINMYTMECKKWGEVLQKIGTNVFRDHFHPLTWVTLTVKEMDFIEHSNPGCWIFITDVRFKNEFNALYENSIMIRVNATLENRLKRCSTSRDPNHISEIDLDDETRWNYVIDNNGSLKEYESAIEKILLDFQ
jgi:hypothetical protein